MAISPNGQFLSLFGNDGHLFVVTIDFTKIIADFKTNAEQPPTILTWSIIINF